MHIGYKAQWLAQGVMFSDYPIKQITCGMSEAEIGRREEQNNLAQKVASDILLRNIEDIAKIDGLLVDGVGLYDYQYHGMKSPVMQAKLDGNTVNVEIFMNLGFNPECTTRGQFKDYTSLYVQLVSDVNIPLGKASDYFNNLTEVAQRWIDRIAKDYCNSIEGRVILPFYFKMICAEIPKEHPLRKVFFSSKEEITKDEINKLIKENPEIRVAYNDLLDIHGKIGEEKYNKQYVVRSNGIYGKNNWINISSVLDDRLTWTGFSDITSAEKIAKFFKDSSPVKDLTLFNRFNWYGLDLGKLV